MDAVQVGRCVLHQEGPALRFHFITTTRNAEQWTERCLNSMLSQKDQEFTINFVDDASTDGTFDAAHRAFDVDTPDNLVGLTFGYQEERRGAPENQCHAIAAANPEPDDVIIIVDGDDYLPHDQVLNRLAEVYADDTVEMTYGSYEPDPPSSTCPAVRPYPKEVAKNRTFRSWTAQHGCMFNHLRTFRFRLFDQIDQDKNFKWPDGTWFDFGVDFAFMIPLLELAGENYRFIPETLLMYNSENPASDWRRSAREADRVHHYVLAELPPVI